MRVSELSDRSGVPLPTIKFYIREGLLPAGQATGRNQAEYDEGHLKRLRLIRALRDDAGLSVRAIAQALRAADESDDELYFVAAAIDALERPSGPSVSERSNAFAATKRELSELLERRGWSIEDDDRSLADAVRALTAARRAFPGSDPSDISPYAEASEQLALHEIPDDWVPSAARDSALSYALLGTVLFEPVLLALRRLAHLSRTRKLLSQRPTRSGGAAAVPKARKAATSSSEAASSSERSSCRDEDGERHWWSHTPGIEAAPPQSARKSESGRAEHRAHERKNRPERPERQGRKKARAPSVSSESQTAEERRARLPARSRDEVSSRRRDSDSTKASRSRRGDDALARIYEVVAAIPRGSVATYGQIAELAGIPSGHRVVARAMRSCPEGLPWQRVVGRRGTRRAAIAIGEPEHAALQRDLLAREGVAFDRDGSILLARSGWLPTDTPSRKPRARK